MGVACQTTICIIGILVLIVLIVLVKGKNDILWNVKRWYNISKTQKGRLFRQICGHILSILLVVLIAFLLSTWINNGHLRTLLNLSYKSDGSTSIKVTTMSSTVFATLMTVLLALITLAVTAYVFLNDALSNRAKYERGVIQTLKSRTRQRLFVNCILSGLCISACLIVDNANLTPWPYLTITRYGVVIVSSFEILCLILYINVIVNYERHLLEYARSYIQFNQRDLCNDKTQYAENSSAIATVIKSIGDIENLINSILQNHESEFRYQLELTSDAMLQAILQNKLKEKTTTVNPDVNIKKICERYRRLLEIRNCLWVMQDYGEDIDVLEELPGLSLQLKDEIKSFAFRKESFVDLSFHDISFSKGDFSQSSMRGSALQKVNFSETNLCNCDFSNGLLREVDLRGADCTGAVFTGARIVSPIIDQNTIFTNAVFGEVEFTFEDNQCFRKTTSDVTREFLYQFKAVSGRRANFIGGRLSDLDFGRAILSEAQFDNTRLVNCNFQWADMSDAVMTNAIIEETNRFNYSNCRNLAAIYSVWGNKSEPELQMDLTGSRFERANLTGSEMYSCIFRKAYINDATFTGAIITGCVFHEAILTNTDFTDTTITRCFFSGSILTNALLAGDSEKQMAEGDIVEGSQFDNAEMGQCFLKNHTFVNCSFNNVILDRAIIRDVKFVGCAFDHAHFDHALLFNVTWENCSGQIETKEENLDFGTFEDRERWREVFQSSRGVVNMMIREKSIYNRHSTRHFDSNYTINKEDQNRILQAGLRAPSPKNRQPWELVVIDSDDAIKQLSSVMETQVHVLKEERNQNKRDTTDLDMALSTASIIRNASMVVLVCYERDEGNEHGELLNWPITAQAFEVADIQAIGACIENMLLMAEEMSIASLWICDVLYAEKELSDAFRLTFPLVAAVAFGKAAPYQSPRKSLSDKVRWMTE